MLNYIKMKIFEFLARFLLPSDEDIEKMMKRI